MPTIWVSIANLANKLVQAVEYVRKYLRIYTILESKYILAKNERLYDQIARKQSLDVFPMFLVRTEDRKAKSFKLKIHSEYRVPDTLYYLEVGKYLELKYRLCSSGLRMEFYLDLFYDLCKLKDNFLGVYIGSTCLVAAKVSRILCVFEMKFCWTAMLFPVILDSRISMDNLLQSVSILNNPSMEFSYEAFWITLPRHRECTQPLVVPVDARAL
jgi:hypothetical protein